MEQHDAARFDIACGDEWRAVGKARPGALGEIRCRFGKNLPFYEHAIGLRHSGKGAEIREIGKRLWLGP
ncbi:hypothetical protein D3C80_2114980 [compost metagenome]